MKNKNNNGYLYVKLHTKECSKTLKVHRIVASCFLGLDLFSYKDPKTSLCVCHKDDNPFNNSVDNLFLGTHKDNIQDMIKKGRGGKTMKGKFGQDNHLSKPVVQIKYGEIINSFGGISEASRFTGISTGNISSCARGKLKSAGGFIWMFE